MRITRRTFGSSAFASAALAIAPLGNLLTAGGVRATASKGLGALAPQYPTNMAELPADLQGIAYASLPAAFEYKIVSYRGQIMRDGNPLPTATDGMAAFTLGRGRIALVRNHELRFPTPTRELKREARDHFDLVGSSINGVNLGNAITPSSECDYG
jgi:hypothetical protein